MLRCTSIFVRGAILLGLLCLPPTRAAASQPVGSMGNPEEISVNSRGYGVYDDHGSTPDEPLTPESDSGCEQTEEVPGWTLDSPEWFYFVGTGGPVVVRLDESMYFGFAVYEGIGTPTVDSLLGCKNWKPRRYEFNSISGHIYRIEVGAWDEPPKGMDSYRLSVFSKTLYAEPAKALPVELGEVFNIGNWGAPFDYSSSCDVDTVTYIGDRSAWAQISVPVAGMLFVTLKPFLFFSWENWMILLYADEGGSKLACSLGSSGERLMSLSAYVTPGTYWLQFTRGFQVRLDSEGSIEENWEVTTELAIDFDVDKDGYRRLGDCDDADPAIHPGAEDVPDDGIDQNCDGVDAHRDADKDLVPDYRDRCPRRSTQGVDVNRDGCPDPRQLSLVARLLLTIHRQRLHVASMVVRATAGASVTLECGHSACERTITKAKKKRLQFGERFDRWIPNGTVVTISAHKPRSIGIEKSYRLSTHGVLLLDERCTMTSRPIKVVKCE